MSSDGRLSTRSPSGSRTGSFRESGPSRGNDHAYQRRTSLENIDERDDNEYEEAVYNEDEQIKQQPKPPRNEDPYVSALKYRFPHLSKSDYAYTRPTGPLAPAVSTAAPPVSATIPTAPPSSAGQNYNTTNKQMPPSSSFNPITSDTNAFQIPRLKPVKQEDKNKYAQTFASQNGDNTTGKLTPSRSGVRIDQPSSNRQTTPYRAENQPHGIATYPGTTTNPHFQTCVQECLERERNRSGLPMHTTHHDTQPTVSFDDYSALGPNYQTSTGTSHYFNSQSHSSPILLLDDLRHINVALARGGISLFPYERFYPASYYPSTPVIDTVNLVPSYRSSSPVQRYIGDVVSACRVADEDM